MCQTFYQKLSTVSLFFNCHTGTVATIGFSDIGLQGFAPKLAKGEIASLSGAGDDPRYFQISVPLHLAKLLAGVPEKSRKISSDL